MIQNKFNRDGVDLITNARYVDNDGQLDQPLTVSSSVAEVRTDAVTFSKKNADGTVEKHDIPSNFVLWSTGIAMSPFTACVSSLLPNQVHRRAIETDAHLRVKGSPLGDVYAIGDCATIETAIVPYLLELIDEADGDNNGKIDFKEFEFMSAWRRTYR